MTLTAIMFAAAVAQPDEIGRYVQTNLHDLTLTDRVLRADQRQLKEINEDFGESYRFGTTTVRMKEPFKLRIDAKVEDTVVSYIIDGDIQTIRVPRANIKQRKDLSHRPGQRQTAFDFGLLTASLFDGLYQAKFVRIDRATGDPVFDVSFVPELKDKSHSRIWIDPQHKVIARREWYRQNGEEEATFTYSDPVQDNGVWIPTHVEVRNVDNNIAGVTGVENIHVNAGIPDDVFK